jgi:hypothetical protein
LNQLLFSIFVPKLKNKMANQISLYGALQVNGRTIQEYTKAGKSTVYIDVASEQVAYVIPTKAADQTGTLVDGFLFVCENKQGELIDSFVLPVSSHLPDISGVLTALTGISTNTTFTKYTTLTAIDYKEVSLSGVIVNDLYQHGRTHLITGNSTLVKVAIKNQTSNVIFTVAGDQTIAGAYTYFG